MAWFPAGGRLVGWTSPSHPVFDALARRFRHRARPPTARPTPTSAADDGSGTAGPSENRMSTLGAS